jgi:hypothetical protein
LAALPEDLINEGVDDKRLGEILKTVASPDAKKILKAAMKERKRSNTPRSQR